MHARTLVSYSPRRRTTPYSTHNARHKCRQRTNRSWRACAISSDVTDEDADGDAGAQPQQQQRQHRHSWASGGASFSGACSNAADTDEEADAKPQQQQQHQQQQQQQQSGSSSAAPVTAQKLTPTHCTEEPTEEPTATKVKKEPTEEPTPTHGIDLRVKTEELDELVVVKHEQVLAELESQAPSTDMI